VASDLSGDFVVVWQSAPQDGSGYGVFGQRYLPILPVELMQFGVTNGETSTRHEGDTEWRIDFRNTPTYFRSIVES
jgi:hypothetical protein